MAEIRLQEYAAKIKDLIQLDQHDEAIAHCQHILRHYPRYVEIYCLLGEACLGKEMVREAIEFFQRTLSADPENLIARMGLGIVFGEQGALLEAIWQVERAFELAPGNTEVRRELQRLYAQRDGVEKTRLKLTRGALGRLYSRNGLYEQAVGEFRAILQQDPDLPDIQLALIEALWREGRRLEVVDVCLDLLRALPNCLKANLILGEIWSRSGHEDAAAEKLEAARSLDPENLMAQELFGKDSPLPPEEVWIAELKPSVAQLGLLRLGADEDRAAAALEREWAGLETPEGAGPEEGWDSGAELPRWLQDLMGQEPEAGLLPGEEMPEEDAGGAQPVLPALPPWLEELEGAEQGEPPALPVGGLPAEAEGAEGPCEGEEVELPAWMADLGELGGEVAAPQEAEEAELPAWLQELGVPARDVSLVSEGPPGLEEAELPDWLRDLRGDQEDLVLAPPAAEGLAGLTALPEEAQLDWQPEALAADVQDLAAEAPLGELEAEAPVGLREDAEAPPGVALPAVTAEAPAAEGAAPAGEGLPDWLVALGVGAAAREILERQSEHVELAEGEAVLPAPAAEAEGDDHATPIPEVPASLLALVEAGILAEEDLAEAMAQMSPEELAAQRAEAVPEWLQDLLVEGEAPAPAPEEIALVAVPEDLEEVAAPALEEVEEVAKAELPAWLQELGAPEGEVAEPALEEAEGVAEADLPAWLQEPGAPEGEVAAPALEEVEEVAETELPAWLQEPGAPEGEVAAPAPEEVEKVESVAEADLPAWLQELGAPEGEVAAPALEEVEEVAEADLPAWLQELGAPEGEVAAPALEDIEEVAEAEPPIWLQELAAPEGEVSVPSEPKEAELPLWLQELGVPEDEVSVPAPEEAEEVEPPAWLQDLAAPASGLPVPEVGEADEWPQAAGMPEAEVLSPLLAETSAALPAEEIPARLEDLIVPEVEKPVAEEAVTAAGPPGEEVRVAEPPALEKAETEAASAAGRRLQQLQDELRSSPRNHRLRLEVARLCAAQSEWSSALGHYEKLIATRKSVPDVIQDLLRLAEEDIDLSRVYQLLGDAYVQEDQLDRALEMYRRSRQALLKR